jgi:hypothetical protein
MVTNVITSNSATGLQRILLDVSWQDADGTPRTQTYDFGIAILGTVDFQVGTSTGSFDPASGAGSVSATVTNLGNAIAHNVYVSLQATSAYAGTQETYLGDINPNTANPFTLQTTLLNLTLLNASAPVGAPTGAPSGGFGGAGRAGVPGQGGRPGGQAANASDTGDFGGRNGTRGIFPAPGGAVVVVRWNDEYGTSHSAIYNLTLRPRAASAAAGAAAATSSASGISKYVPAPTFALVAIALGCAAVAWRRKER